MVQIIYIPNGDPVKQYSVMHTTPFDAVRALLKELTPYELGLIKRDEITQVQNQKRGIKLVPFKGPDGAA